MRQEGQGFGHNVAWWNRRYCRMIELFSHATDGTGRSYKKNSQNFQDPLTNQALTDK